MTDFGSSEAGKRGGKARAERLNKEQRQAIARAGGEARWGKKAIKATHDGTVRVADREIACANLEDGRRVLSQVNFLQAIGRSPKGKGGQVAITADGLPPFLAAERLKPLITEDLRQATVPIVYKGTDGRRLYGYDAMLLPLVCELYIEADDQGITTKQQEHVVKACKVLMSGLARVGIVGLIDAATGYEKDRARDELAKILEAFVAKEIQKWIRTFDLEFYELICELRGEPLERAKKRPQYLGKITNNLVYERLAPGVLQKLRESNPVIDDRGTRKRKFFQHLTPDFGHPKLKEHLASVTTAMKMAKYQGMGWQDFLKLLNKTHPKYKHLPLLDGNGELESD